MKFQCFAKAPQIGKNGAIPVEYICLLFPRGFSCTPDLQSGVLRLCPSNRVVCSLQSVSFLFAATQANAPQFMVLIKTRGCLVPRGRWLWPSGPFVLRIGSVSYDYNTRYPRRPAKPPDSLIWYKYCFTCRFIVDFLA